MADAPGAPGIAPRWTSSDKSGLGTALHATNRVWFTISHGILNECYYPRVDQACTRDFGFIVTDGYGLFAEEKRDTETTISSLMDGVPAYELINTHRPADGGKPRFRIIKRVISDPYRDVVLQQVRLERLNGSPLRLHALLAPHLVNAGGNNTAWLGDYKGQKMLFAEGGGSALALATNAAWSMRSVGYAGVSDGWQDLSRHFRLTWEYDRAVDGNVALVGEVALPENDTAVFALGFGDGPNEAAFRARASLLDDFDDLTAAYARAWQDWQANLRPLDRSFRGHNTYRVSTAVLRTHEAPSFRGGYIASLSIPWGAIKGDDDLGGYHLVWPRDLVETAGGLLAAGANAEALRVLDYLRATQEPDGHWPQNNWLDGSSYWQGVQMDECAFPILLVDLAYRTGALPEASLDRYWPMVRAAAGFLVRNGPVTGQDRWEENAGFSTFTLAVEIAALLVAAEQAERAGVPAAAAYLRDTADAWHAEIDTWVYATDTDLAREAGVAGYYIRMSPAIAPGTGAAIDGPMQIRNRPEGQGMLPANRIVSADALALVRFGLRAANDPRILDTMKVIDRATRTDLPDGLCWHRYNCDGYGEHADGRPFDGTGIGRLWPLLTGERAHVAIAAGDFATARALLQTLESCTSGGALIPEQVWDSDDIPDRQLFRGRPSGSAMPLVWAHAEHLKLLRSLADEAVFDMPPQTVRRYQVEKTQARVTPWRLGFQPATCPQGRALRIELARPSIVLWSPNSWKTSIETPTEPTGLGIHVAEITATEAIVFTWRDAETQAWIGSDFRAALKPEPARIHCAMDQPPTASVAGKPTSPGARVSAAGAHPAPKATLVIFGAHGDLTKRLLMPSLYNLAGADLLDDGFKVIGVDRVQSDDQHWRDELTSTMQEFTHDKTAEFYVEKVDEKTWGWVTQRLSYVQADFTKPEDVAKLKDHVQGNAIFYLAVAARFFGEVVDQLGHAGLLKEAPDAFRRIVIEKPFGEDLDSAKKLNARILQQATEKQIFRIDHFLGKETVQNIMALRFANGIFEPLWKRDHIDYVEIIATETVGVEQRGAFYEPTGALRDMVPNHMFQLLSMVAMEAPNSFDAEAVRSEKAKLLQAIHPVRPEDVVRGQYTEGEVLGKHVNAYRNEPNVSHTSNTETYIALRLLIDNWRWAGVPFYIRTGKCLHGRQTEVVIHFRKPPFALFRDTGVESLAPNTLTLEIQPDEGLALAITAKHPGPKMTLAPIDLRFRYKDAFQMAPNVGYETLIYDCLIGDPTLFQRADMIEASWAAVDPAIKEAGDPPEFYKAGSEGPDGAHKLLEKDNHAWTQLRND